MIEKKYNTCKIKPVIKRGGSRSINFPRTWFDLIGDSVRVVFNPWDKSIVITQSPEPAKKRPNNFKREDGDV